MNYDPPQNDRVSTRSVAKNEPKIDWRKLMNDNVIQNSSKRKKKDVPKV